jgi:phosphatidylglycerol:prolipoprotein diacylglycerol transferase
MKVRTSVGSVLSSDYFYYPDPDAKINEKARDLGIMAVEMETAGLYLTAMRLHKKALAMFQIWRGGLVFYGGFLMAAALMLCYAKVKREPILSLTDFCAVLIPLGHCFGRLGCFSFGCCYGRLCPEAWYGYAFPQGSPAWYHQVSAGLINPYSAHALPVCPIQLIEALGCGVVFGVLYVLYRRYRSVAGLCSAVYCAGYAGLRFVLEFFRDDPRGATYFGFSFSQIISFALLAVAIVLFISVLRRKNDGTVRS